VNSFNAGRWRFHENYLYKSILPIFTMINDRLNAYKVKGIMYPKDPEQFTGIIHTKGNQFVGEFDDRYGPSKVQGIFRNQTQIGMIKKYQQSNDNETYDYLFENHGPYWIGFWNDRSFDDPHPGYAFMRLTPTRVDRSADLSQLGSLPDKFLWSFFESWVQPISKRIIRLKGWQSITDANRTSSSLDEDVRKLFVRAIENYHKGLDRREKKSAS